ncbi:hypothetical protein ATANTOWER_026951 [Ataeniobius toweri]|uniref:Uncharacterized protein n=1 Tax=Ataeniobius toweri TaxID=208326 RepID=A0ABU7BUP7_9TELE|nr:hypothetical protein [Ataeniobius toweri]
MRGRSENNKLIVVGRESLRRLEITAVSTSAPRIKLGRSPCRRADIPTLSTGSAEQIQAVGNNLSTFQQRDGFLVVVCYACVFFLFFLACTLCKCRSFQSPIGVQSSNQLTAQVLILSTHKLLLLFLISNKHICTDICFFISFFPCALER